MNLHLLLARGGGLIPVRSQGLPLASVFREPRPAEPVKPRSLYDFTGDMNDLQSQHWALVVPEGPRGERLLARVARLRRHRADQQHMHPDLVPTYKVSPGMTSFEAEEFRLKLSKLPPERQPRYLLILGDADEVSFEFQQYLAVDRFMGRLSFSREEDFEVYADKVLRAEQEPPRTELARTLFFTAYDGTVATTHGHELLISRSLNDCQRSYQRGKFPASEVLELGRRHDLSATELLSSAAKSTPTALLTLSHGNGGPEAGWSSSGEQRQGQGALVLGNGQVLTADAVGRRPFLPGGVWIYFACFGAGTPARSTYAPWLQRLKEVDEDAGHLEAVLGSAPLDGRPFVAALPQAALANPEGPLAVMGHVDLAWSYAYHDVEGNNHAARFTNVLSDLMKHRRAGVSLYSLTSAIASVDARLAMMYQQDSVARYDGAEPPPEFVDRAHLWMARHDLSAYVLLGDPAVRLPIKPPRW
ncbi:hypothetical protein [Pyxidicoccus sp. MSG2]|uniref:hypothetical protein n=1 Tax=Pyxidicoccus sp. MSG2 TaxID=2996790 RepID=UPI00226F4828|nr:hypothetical protein [Pyxidicoccus sp. MSG2]MCY1018622.1 hypothetical protein [Pyxidicoccus sp. MSG2]